MVSETEKGGQEDRNPTGSHLENWSGWLSSGRGADLHSSLSPPTSKQATPSKAHDSLGKWEGAKWQIINVKKSWELDGRQEEAGHRGGCWVAAPNPEASQSSGRWGPRLVSETGGKLIRSGRWWSFHLPSVQELWQWTSGTERQDIAGEKGVGGLRRPTNRWVSHYGSKFHPLPKSLVANYIKKTKQQNQNPEKRQAIKVHIYNHSTARKTNNRNKRGQFNNKEK